MEMKYVTSYFGNQKKLRAKGFKIVSIAVGQPRYMSIDGEFSPLAPRREMLSMSQEMYDREMDKILKKVDVKLLKSYLRTLMQRGYDKIAFCCHEKDHFTCHRLKVAEWLRTQGMTIEEFGYKEPVAPDATPLKLDL